MSVWYLMVQYKQTLTLLFSSKAGKAPAVLTSYNKIVTFIVVFILLNQYIWGLFQKTRLSERWAFPTRHLSNNLRLAYRCSYRGYGLVLLQQGNITYNIY